MSSDAPSALASPPSFSPSLPVSPAAPLVQEWLWPSAFLLSAGALGHALQLNNGNGHPVAFQFLLAAVLLATLGLFASDAFSGPQAASSSGLEGRARAWLTELGPRIPLALAAALLAFQLGQLLTTPPGMYLRLGRGGFILFYGLIGVAAVLGGAALSAKPLLGRLHVPALLCIHFAMGVWLLHSSPNPFIDVYVFQKQGVAGLLAGQNPYTLRFPDIYGNSPFYGPGMSVNGVLQFGFPYPPLSLLLVVPGKLLGGDYRYAQLFALTVSGALMAYARPSAVSRAAALLFLFTPRIFFVLEQGWTEPLLVLMLSATVFAACRLPRLVPYCFGLLAALKQYVVFAVPAYLLLLPRPWRLKDGLQHAARGLALGLAVTLPLALWDFSAFYQSVIALQFLQPFRVESLSFLVWSVNNHGWPPESLYSVLPIGVALVAAPLAVWRAPRTPAGFAAAVGFTLLLWFSVTKQSFCNHYFFPLGALFWTAAASGETNTEQTGEQRDVRT